MAKLQFRLATLQRLRESHRDEMRAKLAEAYQAEQMLQEQKQSVHAEEEKLRQLHLSSVQEENPNVSVLLEAQRYGSALKGQLTTIESQSKMLAAETEKRRQALVEADQQVRVLEKLYERQLKDHSLEQQRAEVKLLDEVAAQRREIEPQ